MTKALKSMENSKSPGNDGLTVEFYKFFWNDLKYLLYDSFLESKTIKKLGSSQRQAVIKLLTKKDKDKKFIENWRPISLLNVDTKILSKVLANRLKPTLPSIISNDQTAYVPGRFIDESVRLVSDIIELTDVLQIKGYIVTVDIQKALITTIFLLATFKKHNFGENFIDCIKIILRQKKIDYLFSVTWSKTMCGMRNYLFIFYFGSKDDLKCAHVFILTNLRLY